MRTEPGLQDRSGFFSCLEVEAGSQLSLHIKRNSLQCRDDQQLRTQQTGATDWNLHPGGLSKPSSLLGAAWLLKGQAAATLRDADSGGFEAYCVRKRFQEEAMQSRRLSPKRSSPAPRHARNTARSAFPRLRGRDAARAAVVAAVVPLALFLPSGLSGLVFGSGSVGVSTASAAEPGGDYYYGDQGVYDSSDPYNYSNRFGAGGAQPGAWNIYATENTRGSWERYHAADPDNNYQSQSAAARAAAADQQRRDNDRAAEQARENSRRYYGY